MSYLLYTSRRIEVSSAVLAEGGAMAQLGPFPVEFGTVFPSGAYAAGASRW